MMHIMTAMMPMNMTNSMTAMMNEMTRMAEDGDRNIEHLNQESGRAGESPRPDAAA